MVEYKRGNNISLDLIKQLYIDSTLSQRRPADDDARLAQMIQHATIMITAWDNKKLIGLSRGFSDFSYVTYISDLCVHKDYQKKGIGKALIEKTHEATGPNTKLVLLSAPDAEPFYKKIGFDSHPRAYIYDKDTLFN